MENPISISQLNDFIFCPMSIYFHSLYQDVNTMLYHSKYQQDGLKSHESIDHQTYSTNAVMLLGIEVYCEEYNLIGKIDMYNTKTHVLIERKKLIKQIYDGYIFQLYAQYFAMKEMGYTVEEIKLHSCDDNKTYHIALPEEDIAMFARFKKLIKSMNDFDMQTEIAQNENKCKQCIYRLYCDRCLYDEP